MDLPHMKVLIKSVSELNQFQKKLAKNFCICSANFLNLRSECKNELFLGYLASCYTIMSMWYESNSVVNFF